MAAMITLIILMSSLLLVSCGNEHNTACNNYFHRTNTCPDFEYEDVNLLCCKDLPGEKLHCINTYDDNGNSIVIHGCLDETTIPKGHAMSLVPKESPNTIRLIKCRGEYFQSQDRKSTDVRHDYCTESKTDCSKEGKILLCDGGPDADNQCACGDGYKPYPEQGKQGNFPCEKEACLPGTARNQTYRYQGKCPRNRIKQDYTCYSITATTRSTPTPTTTKSSSLTPPMSNNAEQTPKSRHDVVCLCLLLLLTHIII